ncbi:MAG: dienelactone hydrolase family protein [Candidatus Melainabacteria bacterium]|nr:dienelactone hydrolase family protein [Candidatus Melainabacteria bacterium]
MSHQKVSITAADGESFSAYLALPQSGQGPAILLIQEIFGVNPHIRKVADYYAQEGYVVLAPDLFFRMWPNVELGYNGGDMETAISYKEKFDEAQGLLDLAAALDYLRALPQVTGGVAALGHGLGGRLAYRLAAHAKLEGTVSYYGADIDKHLNEADEIASPIIFHLGADDPLIPAASMEKVMLKMVSNHDARVYVYENAGHGFNCEARASYNQRAALLAQARTIEFLHACIGPKVNIEELFDHHLFTALNQKDLDGTLETLTEDAVVTFVPTLSGGHGQNELQRFYKDLFKALGGDAQLTTISRTINANRVVDELVLSFTHDRPMDFILPAVAPTQKKVTIPLVMLATFCLEKLSRLNVYWDQASVILQVGILPDEDSQGGLRLPAHGSEQANKILDDSVKIQKIGSRIL